MRDACEDEPEDLSASALELTCQLVELPAVDSDPRDDEHRVDFCRQGQRVAYGKQWRRVDENEVESTRKLVEYVCDPAPLEELIGRGRDRAARQQVQHAFGIRAAVRPD